MNRLIVLVAALLLATMLAGCSSTPAPSSAPAPAAPAGSESPAAGDTPAVPADTGEEATTDADTTLRLLSWQAPTILNPHLARGSKDYFAARIAYEPLATYDSSGNLVPILAAAIPSPDDGSVAADGTAVTWHLRDDVRWSDGEPFTAADVAFTYEFLANPDVAATSRAQYDAVERVEVVDEHTVTVHFRDTTPAWALPFVGPRGLIIPRHIFEPYNGANVQEALANIIPVGTGPYQVIEFTPGDMVVYEVNPHYRDADTLFFRRVELKGGGDATTAARAVLQTGEADFAENLQVEAPVLDAMLDPAVGQLITVPRPLVEHILLNRTDPNTETASGERSSIEHPHPFFSDPLVRQAFALAIDRDTIAANLYGANGQPTSNVLVEPAPYRSPNTSFAYDLERAATLLDEAGWRDSDGDGVRDKDGVALRVLFQTATGSVRQKTQEIIKQSLEELGVAVELKSIDPAVFFDNDPANTDTYAHFYADMQMFTIPYDSPDPGGYMQGWLCSELAQQENNWSKNNVERWCSEEYDRLYAQAQREMDPDKRRELFIAMNDLLINDVVVIPIVHRTRVSGAGIDIAGIDATPWDETVWNIAQWSRSE